MEEKKKKVRGRLYAAARIGEKAGFLETYDVLDDRSLEKYRSMAADGEACR